MGEGYGAARAAVAVSAARLRAEPRRPALVVAGVALAFAMLVSVSGGSLASRQQALASALGAVPESGQRFRVDRFGVPLVGREYPREDAAVKRVLGTLSRGGTTRIVFFRQLRVQGRLVEIAALDGLAQAVRLRTGRLPLSCTNAECEVLAVGASGLGPFAEGDLRFRRVGVADLRDPALFAYISSAGEGVTPPLLLLAPSVDSLQRLSPLAPFYRVYSWLSPLRADRLRTWEIGGILSAESQAQNELYATDPAFRLSSPDDVLLDASHRGKVAAQRLMLVGGETSALLLGFAIIAAIGLRRGLANERRRLLARGARRWQASLALGAEVGGMTLAGALLGIAVGAAVVAGIAGAADLPAGAILRHSLLAPRTVVALAAAWVVITLVLAFTTLSRDRPGDRRRVGLADVGAVGAAATIAVALSRGALDPESVSTGNTALLLVLPALVCFVVAVLLSRLLTPAMRAAERISRARSVSIRLSVLALARAPSRTVVSCSFVAVALGLALFAATYRTTLARGAADQAAFEVPLDYTVAEGSQLVLPLDAAPLSRYARLGEAYPVVRRSATTPGSGATVLSPTVLGLPARAVERLHWRSDFSTLSLREIARRLAPPRPFRLDSVSLPAGARTLSVRARLRGADVRAALVLEDARGRIRTVPFGRARPGSTTLTGHLPPGALRLVGLRLDVPESEEFQLAHNEAEGEVSRAPSGTLALGPLVAGRRIVTDWRGWGLDGAPSGPTVAFTFTDTALGLVFRPAEPTDGRPIPVVVSQEIARAAGGVGAATVLDFQDTHLDARIVGVAARMPGVPTDSGPFVLADGTWLSTALDAGAPGEGMPSEVWIASGRDVSPALAKPPFARLDVSSREQIRRRLAGDPLAHATALAFGAAGIVALVLAVLGFLLAVVSELRDERSDFFDLEAQGVPPRRLRTQLRTRGVILLLLGLLGGAGLGALLSLLVVSLVRVAATTALPQPPIVLDPAWLLSALGVVLLAGAALLVAEGASLAAFRAPRPGRSSWSLG